MDYKLNIGNLLPEFQAKDHENYTVSDEDIIGTPLVLFFYPKDCTSGCTKEACAFQKHMEEFDNLDVLVLGISPDNLSSHQKFIQENKLEFTLLSDPDHKMAKSFDVLRDGKIQRTTFLLDATGMIRWIERPVEVEGHAERVLEAVKKHIPKEHISKLMGDVEKNFSDFLKESPRKKPKK